MELDELQRAWSQLDARLAAQGQLLGQMQRQRGMDSVRSRLRWLSLGQLVELGVGVAIAVGVEWYMRRHPERCAREHVGGLLRRAEADLDALTSDR